MKDKKQTKTNAFEHVLKVTGSPQIFYDGKPVPEWLQLPVTDMEHREKAEAIPDWVLQPVFF